MKLKPAYYGQVKAVEMGIVKLREARELFKHADSPKTVERIRKALRSADGALRHVDRRLYRSLKAIEAAPAVEEPRAP